MSEQGATHGPRADEALKREVRSELQAHRATRAEEWLEPEPPGEDQPEATWALGSRPGAIPPGADREGIELRSNLARHLDRAAFPATTARLRAWSAAVLSLGCGAAALTINIRLIFHSAAMAHHAPARNEAWHTPPPAGGRSLRWAAGSPVSIRSAGRKCNSASVLTIARTMAASARSRAGPGTPQSSSSSRDAARSLPAGPIHASATEEGAPARNRSDPHLRQDPAAVGRHVNYD